MFTKSEFDKITAQAKQYANEENYEVAMSITGRKLESLHAAGISGKYVTELGQITHRYERMYNRSRDQQDRRELPHAD
jgi:hypothetical protein